MKKILLIQLRRIGDVLMTTPAIHQLREHYSDAKISFLTEKPADQVLAYNPHLDQVIIYDKLKSFLQNLKWLLDLRKEKYDLVIDFQGNPRSALIAGFTRAPQRIGFAFRGRKFFYSSPVALQGRPRYSAEDKCLLLIPLGIQCSHVILDFGVDKSDEDYVVQLFQRLNLKKDDFVVSISPVSRQKYKVWASENFAEIADTLIQKFNAKILFVYGPEEKHFVDRVRLQMKKEALPDYPVPTLRQTCALLRRVTLHIGNDNGPRHFAVASDTPSVTIFGRPRAVNWTPPEPCKHISLEYDPGCKQNCFYPKCELECLTGVTVKDVWAATLKQIEQFKMVYRD